ncbi:MAG: hypothetical protein ACRDFQ_06000, partial [Anaerolineales bacterium]
MKTRFAFRFLLAGILLSACGGLPGVPDERAVQTEIAAQVLTALAPAATEPAATAESTAVSTDTSAPPDTGTEAVIVFQPGGLFSEEQRNNILTRVVNPFILYHQGLEGHPPLVSIS